MRNLLFKIGMTICTGTILLALLTGCAATASSTAAATTPTQTAPSQTTSSTSDVPAAPPDGAQAGSLAVTLDSTSMWILSADSYVSAFNGSMDNVVTNGHTLYVNGSAVK